MKLDTEFIQLPLLFDSERLLREVESIEQNLWVTHPMVKDNLAVILVSVDGKVNDDFALSGQMAPHPVLNNRPYLRQVIASLQAPVSRTRLMMIGPNSLCPPHDDIGYHWYRRTRVHIPIVTNPKVTFHCNKRSVHMKAGECWTFDNFLNHAVTNEGQAARIHLVIDTKGSDPFWKLASQGRKPFAKDSATKFEPKLIPYNPGIDSKFEVEKFKFEVFEPSEFDRFCNDIVSYISIDCEAKNAGKAAQAFLSEYSARWREMFSKYGHSLAGKTDYAELLNEMVESEGYQKLNKVCKRYTKAGEALGIFKSLFWSNNREIEYSPDSEVLNLSLLSLKKKKAG